MHGVLKVEPTPHTLHDGLSVKNWNIITTYKIMCWVFNRTFPVVRVAGCLIVGLIMKSSLQYVWYWPAMLVSIMTMVIITIVIIIIMLLRNCSIQSTCRLYNYAIFKVIYYYYVQNTNHSFMYNNILIQNIKNLFFPCQYESNKSYIYICVCVGVGGGVCMCVCACVCV